MLNYINMEQYRIVMLNQHNLSTHLILSTDFASPTEAQTVAKSIIAALPLLRGFVFIESVSDPATASIGCKRCDQRLSTRFNFL